jgi:TolB-like protein
MFTDMLGYTALGQRNESLSLVLVEEQRKLIRPVLRRHNGREIKTIGDAFLVEFLNALDAVRCAYDIQRATREFNISLPAEKRIHLRVGVHLGDVVESRGDISGDAVNVASRLESLAEDGGVCLSRQVHDQVQNKFELTLESLGPKQLKNVSSTVEVFRMVMPWERERDAEAKQFDKRRIAILPFANMSPDPADEYFADGITDEIISTISGISGLSVISRTSVMGYKRTTKKLREIGNDLEVGSVLEGSFKKAGSKIRVTAQLIDVAADRHLWAQNYDREVDDVFEVQSDIAKQVADALRVRILSPEVERIQKRPTKSTAAYTLYLKGRQLWNKRELEDVKNAIRYFELAIEEDSNFALAHLGLADCHTVLRSNFGTSFDPDHAKAKAALEMAMELDPSLAEAQATMGNLLLQDYRLREAEERFRKAIELKPNYAFAHMWYYNMLVDQLRWEEALSQIETAVELDPLSPPINVNHAQYYFAKREFRKCAEFLERLVELHPDYSFAHAMLGFTYGRLKMYEATRREFDTWVGLMQESFPLVRETAELWMGYLKEDREKVRTLLPTLEARLEETTLSDALVAGLHFFLGETDEGFEWVERSFAKREWDLLDIQDFDLYDGVRTQTRYIELLRRLGLN